MSSKIASSPQIYTAANGLRILCFDGGGVRGKASLLILKEIMDRVGPGAMPCDFFDLIAGTSTGSLIAIMLARLRYSVEEAIEKYDQIGPRVFCNVESKTRWILHGSPAVDTSRAEEAFREIGRVNGKDEDMDNGLGGCKCYVTTVLQDHPDTLVPIRSYSVDEQDDPVTHKGEKWKIWQAARAATAAPIYFKPLELIGRQFVDAGIGYNNPSVEVFHEITKNIPEYKDRDIACFVSIGTGISETRPAPKIPEVTHSRFGGIPKPKEVQDRVTTFVHYVTSIASSTTPVHREMRRTHMPKKPYFRFDPGPEIGAIELEDFSQLQRMPNLWWNYMRQHEEIITSLDHCARTLKTASPTAVQALAQRRLLLRPKTADAVQGGASSSQPVRIPRRPPPPEIPDWQSIKECVDIVLGNPDTVPALLVLFSLSCNLDRVLDELEKSYCSNSSGMRAGVLSVVAKFTSHLWLTDPQITKLSEAFSQTLAPKTAPLILADTQAVVWMAVPLAESLRKLKEESQVTMPGPIASLESKKQIKLLAMELTQALVVLEDELRRSDAAGECVRWAARNYKRDFLSFPERVELWVLQSVLSDGIPKYVGLRYLLFYKVAKRLKEIHNLSALQAIMSALQQLKQIRIGAKVKTTAVSEMTNLSYQARKYDTQKARRQNKPYLQCLEDILPRDKFTVDNLAVAHHVRWSNYLVLLQQVEAHISQTPLTSTQQYAFSQNPHKAFVKKCLVDAKPVERVASKVDEIVKLYRESLPDPGPLFRESVVVRTFDTKMALTTTEAI